MAQPFAPGILAPDLAARGTDLVVPVQYCDRVVLERASTRLDPNAEVKQAFGLP